MESKPKYRLDLHGEMILEEYHENLETFAIMKSVVEKNLASILKLNGIIVTAVETRIKTEESLGGKLELKGSKYASLADITDILGARVITFYNDDVDKISALVEKSFKIDWDNSVDKRRMHEIDSFGYMSLHYICSIPEKMYSDPGHPDVNRFRFEIQMRTALQHVWATLHHDTGYKSDIEVPTEYLRSLNRLAGILELADEEFCRIRRDITNYRRQVTNLVRSGKLADIPLNGDAFHSYMELRPFDKLLERIAAINQAEILEASMRPYISAFKYMGFKSLGDIESLIKNYSDDAFRLALMEIGGTDLDIISATVAVQDLCVVYILQNGGGISGLEKLFEIINGENAYNRKRAERIFERAGQLSLTGKNIR